MRRLRYSTKSSRGFVLDLQQTSGFERRHLNKKQRRLYIFAEIYQVNLKTRKAVEEIRKLNPENRIITADSEEPRSIAAMNELGLRVYGAKKGPGSVDFGMAYLSDDLDEIIIDPVRCPNAAREFSTYELERDKNGNFKGSYPDQRQPQHRCNQICLGG